MKVHGWIDSEDIFIMNEDEVKEISTSDQLDCALGKEVAGPIEETFIPLYVYSL